MSNRVSFAGLYNAWDFAYGINPSVPGLTVDYGVPAGAGTITLAWGQVAMSSAGISFNPLNVNAPVNVGASASGSSNYETQTPTAVSNLTPTVYDTATITATWTYAHGKGDPVSSGSVGLQEALNYCSAQGGGSVVIDNAWANNGGTNTILDAATIPAGVSIQDNRSGAEGDIQSVTVAIANAAVLTLGTSSDGVLLVPAPGAGNMVDVIDMVVENVFKTGAYTFSGALQASYGNATTVPATATIASTFLSGPTANQIIKVAGALASNLSSAILNTGIYFNATANPSVGAGSLIVKLTYRIMTGF